MKGTKGLKSKGKSLQPKPRQQATNKVKSLAMRYGKNASKQFKVQFFDGKVIFNISQIEPILQRALIYVFKQSKRSLFHSSVLLKLKMPKRPNYEVTYRHYLDTNEAVLLYNRLIRKRLGEVNKAQKLKEVIEIIETYPMQSQQLEQKQELEDERQHLNRRIERFRRLVKTYYLQYKQSIKNKFKNSQQSFKAKILQHRIRQLSGNLIDKMVVAIRQVSPNKIDVIFQQPYPQKACKPQFLIQAIGQTRYLNKKINFGKYYREARMNHKLNTNFFVCHYCKQLLLDIYVRCIQQVDSQLLATCQNSPNTYYRHVLALDYCHHPITQWTQQQLEQQLDYFKYFSNGEANICNRFICVNCQQKTRVLTTSEEVLNYKCQFCTKTCTCQSCLIGKELVRSLALYKQVMINNYQPLDKYFQMIRFANLDHPTEVEVQRHIRYTFKDREKRFYWQYYSSLLQNFKGINDAMDRLQLEAVRSPQIYSQLQIMITQYMKKAREYCLQIRQKEDQTPQTEVRSKKTPAFVKRMNHSLLQEMARQSKIKPTNGQQLQNLLQLDVKDIDRVLLQVYNLTPLQQQLGLSEQDLKKIKSKLTFLKPLRKDEIPKLIRLKTSIPFQQIDYELAANVPKQNKMIRQREIQIMRNVRQRIMFDQDDGVYGFKGVATDRFPTEQEEFVHLLQMSDYSESSEQIQQGDSSIPNPSISISKSFLEKHNIQLSGQDSDFSSQSQWQDVDSSFILNQRADQSRMQDQVKRQITKQQHSSPKLQDGGVQQEQSSLKRYIGELSREQDEDGLQQISRQEWRKYVKQ